MKLKALTRANPKMRPIRSEKNGRHLYIVYAHPLAFRDLKNDAVITAAQREVATAMENERLFKGGDLLWDGMIIKEAHGLYDTSTYTGEGAGGTDTVVPVYLCGAQAIGAAYAKRWSLEAGDLRLRRQARRRDRGDLRHREDAVRLRHRRPRRPEGPRRRHRLLRLVDRGVAAKALPSIVITRPRLKRARPGDQTLKQPLMVRSVASISGLPELDIIECTSRL